MAALLALDMTLGERWPRATCPRVGGMAPNSHAILPQVHGKQPGKSGRHAMATEKRKCRLQHGSGSTWAPGLESGHWIQTRTFNLTWKLLRDPREWTLETMLPREELKKVGMFPLKGRMKRTLELLPKGQRSVTGKTVKFLTSPSLCCF